MIKLLADRPWLTIGKTNKFKELKKEIANICRDVTKAGCIDEICINDILQTLRKHEFEVIAKDDLDTLKELAHRYTSLLD